MLKNKGLIFVSGLIAASSALGGVAGWFLGNMYKVIGPVQNQVYVDKPVEFSNNYDSVKKLLGAAKVKSMSELSNVDVSSLVGVGGLTIGDIAEASQLYLYEKDNVVVKSNNFAYSKVMGVVNEQYTNSTWIKKGELYFKENVSYSKNAQFGERTYNMKSDAITPITKPFENELTYYRVKGNQKATNVDFTNAKKESYFINTPDTEVDENGNLIKSYSTTFGASVFKAFNYDWNDDSAKKDDKGGYAKETVGNSKTQTETTYEPGVKKTETGYEISLAIKEEAMANYASYIYTTTRDAMQLAKMKEKPHFVACGVKIITDKNLTITNIHTDEFYNVISAIAGEVPTTCTSDLTVEYKEEKIPNFKEKIAYEG